MSDLCLHVHLLISQDSIPATCVRVSGLFSRTLAKSKIILAVYSPEFFPEVRPHQTGLMG